MSALVPGARRAVALWRASALGVAAAALTASCATVPPPAPPVISWEEKLQWMMRLEDQRILRDPNPPPPRVLQPATGRRPAIVAPPPPSDIVRLLQDAEARVRRRAALAAGRVRLPEAIEPLSAILAGDQDPEVRQMAAFALGLIGQASARPALVAALRDPMPIVQGRAAQAIGLIGDATPESVAAVVAMVRGHVAAGALQGIQPDDLTYPLAPAVEAARLGLYALVQLGRYEPVASAVLDGSGQPASTWWPIAYAVQRVGDPKAAPALLALLRAPGRYTAAFAARGLGVIKAAEAVDPLVGIVTARQADEAVIVEAMRALASIGDARAGAALTAYITDPKASPLLRLEAVTAIGAVKPEGVTDVLLDLLSDPSAPMRAAATKAVAAIDAEALLLALSGLDPDRDWTVRAAQASALAQLAPEQAQPRLTAMLKDPDQRVIPAVLQALVTMKAPGIEQVLLEHLKASDFVVRAAAANGLGELNVVSAAPALADAVRAAAAEDTYVARAAALAALAKIDASAARPVLEASLRDRDWAVRLRAAMLLRDLGAPPAAEAIRPAPSGRELTEAEWRWVVAPPYSPHAYIETERGTVEIELAVLDAPMTVASFVDLARRRFFDGIPIHRVVPDFVVQDGDPRGDGEGGPGYTLRDEINQHPYLRGTVGMALDWADTGGSQFFITHSPQPHLDARYTVFGYVVNGLEVVDRIQPRDVIKTIRIRDGVTDK